MSVNPDNVSKWVASKLKSIAACIRVALSGYEHEVIKLLSRIESSNVMPKPAMQRTPPSSRRQRELRRLEFAINYDRPCTSTSGLMLHQYLTSFEPLFGPLFSWFSCRILRRKGQICLFRFIM